MELSKSLERVIAHGSPWVYADALRQGPPPAGTIADLLDTRGRFLARGVCERGPIAFRVLTLDRDEVIDSAFWRRRLRDAISLRDHVDLSQTNAYRMIHGEADRLPGLVVDRYGEHAVVRLDGSAMPQLRASVYAELFAPLESLGVKHIHEVQGRGPTRSLETLRGKEVHEAFVVQEHGMKLVVDLLRGQKTGLFLDHRESRRELRLLCERWIQANGKGVRPRVLNLYGYTGGFSVAAGLGGAQDVTTVDISAPALEMARQSWAANDLEAQHHHCFAGKAEHFLKDPDRGTFDIVIADPPSFAPHEKAKAKALGAYKAMHRASLECVRPGGFYLTASCSSHVDRQAFEATLREGAHGAGVALQILGRWGAGADHPVLLAFGAGDYLCALLARVSLKRSKA